VRKMRATRAEGEAATAGQKTSPTDLIVHAGLDMELATCPAGESNRARSLIGKALSGGLSTTRASSTSLRSAHTALTNDAPFYVRHIREIAGPICA
jgi:hypothetical protein